MRSPSLVVCIVYGNTGIGEICKIKVVVKGVDQGLVRCPGEGILCDEPSDVDSADTCSTRPTYEYQEDISFTGIPNLLTQW